MAETFDAKKREKENIDIYENIVVFIELRCLYKCSQLYEKYFGNKSAVIFHNSSHKSADYLVLVLCNWEE